MMRNPGIVIGYLLGGALVVAGILILTGLFKLRAAWDPLFATMFGIVTLLFGIYRIVLTDTKRRRPRQESVGDV
ncbi:MAG: hypothetical protein KDD67_00115 [Ignavibacteriae bacterium]|nr:hypothetical protein [Ignavibacteriota bacterium]MCB9214760.1 hypothetical protein [Ignavibacteria bacterium]